jgi:cell division protein FtsZ
MTDLHFNLPKEQSSIIKVIGVGGGGSNAVNHMFKQGIVGVNFIVCNTDSQALDTSPVPNKIQLGPETTSGLGAGSNPEVGKVSCEESEEEIREILSKNTKMVFITAGMGGGTGTGAAPVVAKIAKEMGILTVGIVTTPFSYEGTRKIAQAEEGIRRMKEHVDTVLVISNDKLREMYASLKRSEAFAIANNILATAAKSISEIITVPGEINVDFADVAHVMGNSGVAIMGVGIAEGEDRALRAVQSALNSPLLNDNDITGAKKILINISSGSEEMSIDEIETIMEYVREAANTDSDVIFGTVDDVALGDQISVTIIATGFESVGLSAKETVQARKVLTLGESKPVEPQQTLAFELPSVSKEIVVDETLMFDTLPQNSINNSVDAEWEMPKIELFEETNPTDDLLGFELKNPSEPTPKEFVAPEFRAQEDEHQEMEKFSIEPNSQVNNVEGSVWGTNEIDYNESELIRNERKNRLRDMSLKFQNPGALQELENQPAYLRRNKALEEVPHSSESNVSKYTVNSMNINGESRPEIKKNNPFLHDTVD